MAVAQRTQDEMMPEAKTIAILDDNPDVLQALDRIVSAHGHHVHLFSSANSFMKIAAELPLDCLVTDIHLGGDCGLEMVRLLSAFGVKIPVIFITGSDDEALRWRAMELDCVAYLSKPFDAGLLMAAIERSASYKIGRQ